MADYEKAQALARKKGIDIMEAARTMHMDAVPFTPLGRLGMPGDVASMVLFLCSAEASFITGQAINVDGGRLTAH